MRYICYLAFVLLFLIGGKNTFSQQHFERVGPVVFSGIQKLSSGKIIACSETGSIYSSTDGGVTWKSTPLEVRRNLLCLRFADDQHGMVGTAEGSVLITTNSGATWSEQHTGYNIGISAISYPAQDTVYVATSDGQFLKSINGGKEWNAIVIRRTPASMICRVRKVVFPTSAFGVVGGDSGRVFSTSNAGETWKDESGPDNKHITALDATIDGKIAYAIDGYIYSTLDRFNWRATLYTLGDTLKKPFDVLKIKNDTIIVFLRGGKYRITRTFAGNWWADRLLPSSEIQDPTLSFNSGVKFNDIYYDDNIGEGLAVGSWGTVYKLSDFARKGELIHHCNIGTSSTTDWVYVKGLESNSNIVHAIAHLGERFAHSSDGGTTWLTQTEKNYGFGSYMGLHFKDDSTGIIFTGSRKNINSPGFLNTTNNGASWGYDAESIRDNMYSVTKSNYGKLYITADSTVYVSNDEGFTWDTLWSFSASFFDTSLHQVRFMIRSATFLENDSKIFLEIWAMDLVRTNPVNGARITHSMVLVSTDGGVSWEKRHSFPEIHTVNGMRFITPQLGYAMTYFTAIKDSSQTTCWRTTDGGYTWESALELGRSWTPLTFGRNGKYGILSSTSKGEMYVTTDSGYSWSRDSVIYPNGNVKFVLSHFIDDSTAMVTSNVGFWRKSFGAPKSSVEWKKATSNPYLFIYTNPSPVTGNTIRCRVDGLFSIKDERSISLKIYDLLGREVKDLSQLTHSNNDGIRSIFEFQALGLSNGVYTLVLTTSDGGAVRNMVVVK